MEYHISNNGGRNVLFEQTSRVFFLRYLDEIAKAYNIKIEYFENLKKSILQNAFKEKLTEKDITL